MKLSIKCPNCNENLSINIIDDKIVSVELDGTINLSDEDIKTILNSMNIEFGTIENII